MTKFPEGRQASAVIPLLYVAQRQMGRLTQSAWVPRVAMDVIAARLSMPPIRVYEVATFYFMFNMKPIGRHHLQLCGTTPCMLRGAEDIKKVCEEKIGPQRQVRADGKFSWLEVECLGACVNAPMVQINDDYYEDLDYESTVKLLEACKRGERPKPGSAIGRQASAPAGEQSVLTGRGEG